MNNIEVLKNIRYFIDCDTKQKGEQKKIWLNTLDIAISALKALEEAEGVLPKKMLTGKPPIQANWGNGIIDGHNTAVDFYTPVVAKLLLRIKELEKRPDMSGSYHDVEKFYKE